MKLAFYGLAAIALAGLGIGLPFSAAEVVKDERPQPVPAERVVYVDTARLLQLHPSWNSLQQIRETISRVESSRRTNPVRQAPEVVVGRSAPVAEARPDLSRSDLLAQAGQAAVRALHDLEVEQHEALWLKLHAERENMTKATEAEVASQARQIREESALEAKLAEVRYCPERLSTTLKLGALQTAAATDAIGLLGASARLGPTQAKLNELDMECAQEQRRISSLAKSRISALHQSALEDVDRRVEVARADETSRIEANLIDLRDDLLKGLRRSEPTKVVERSSLSNAGSGAGEAQARATASVPAARETDEETIAGLRSIAASLEARIGGDVGRAVRELAAEQGLKVVTKRGGTDLADHTAAFAKLMQKRSWRAFGPVLCEMRGS